MDSEIRGKKKRTGIPLSRFVRKPLSAFFRVQAESFEIGQIRVELRTMRTELKRVSELLLRDYLERNLASDPARANRKCLNFHELQVHSQHGEDGIIEEIFRRIGETSRVFVEFGAGYGFRGNTLYPLLRGWSGHWIETSEKRIAFLKSKFHPFIEGKQVSLHNYWLTPDNIEDVFRQIGLEKEFDLLSIDIDGNDYWVWQAIKEFRPRAVALEYNAGFGPSLLWVMKYNPSHQWDGTTYFGASLKSLELLGREKGYSLVGCDFAGVNAFFVRNDLLQDKFLQPYTAVTHYHPPRGFLCYDFGPPKGFGEFVSI